MLISFMFACLQVACLAFDSTGELLATGGLDGLFIFAIDQL